MKWQQWIGFSAVAFAVLVGTTSLSAGAADRDDVVSRVLARISPPHCGQRYDATSADEVLGDNFGYERELRKVLLAVRKHAECDCLYKQVSDSAERLRSIEGAKLDGALRGMVSHCLAESARLHYKTLCSVTMTSETDDANKIEQACGCMENEFAAQSNETIISFSLEADQKYRAMVAGKSHGDIANPLAGAERRCAAGAGIDVGGRYHAQFVQRHRHASMVNHTRAILRSAASVLELYKFDHGRYPTSMAVLRQSNYSAMLKRTIQPYLDRVVKDSWGNELAYTPTEDGMDFRLASYGRDGKPGGSGEDADLERVRGQP